MDRCALFVDASYVLADGAMAVHGTRRRESVSWDYPGLLQLLGGLATERSGLPLLRTYWYEATAEGRRTTEHDDIADQPGVKLRVTKARPGRREGVEGEIHRDLTRLARNRAVSDAMVVSAEDDLTQVIADVQDMGLRVTLLQIAGDGTATVSRALRQECDDFTEVDAAQLRPFVELISGAEPSEPSDSLEPSQPDEAETDAEAEGTVSVLYPPVNATVNGNGHGPTPSAEAPPAPRELGQPEASPSTAETTGTTDYPAAADYYGSVDYGSALDYGRVPDYAAPTPAPAPVPVGAATANSMPANSMTGSPMPPARPPASPARADIYGAPVAGSAQVRQLPPRGPAAPAGPAPVQAAPAPGLSPLSPPSGLAPVAPPQPVLGAPTIGQQTLGPVLANPVPANPGPASPVPSGPAPTGQPSGSLPVAPVVPMDRDYGRDPNGFGPNGRDPNGRDPNGRDPNGLGYPGARGTVPAGPRPVLTGPGGAGGNTGPGPQAPLSAPPGPGPASTVPASNGPGGVAAPSGPIGLVGPGGYGAPPSQPGVSLGDAVQSAHEEGQAFGESVARDAPALWLEAVLARKPRMPTDLEARLLQGSALPIDFLLHDEVRHALRRGFWDALERARR